MSWDGPLMGDAAYAKDLFGTSFAAAGGYLDSPAAYHPWSEADWGTIPGPKLPIWVAAGKGHQAGTGEAKAAVVQLKALGVPKQAPVVIDLETRIDPEYVAAFYAVLQVYGFGAWPYGSASTVFANPACDGYWAADYAGIGPFMYNHPAIRATQYTSGARYDTSAVKQWTLDYMWK